MAKLLKFADPKFFGADFKVKYNEFKQRTLNDIGTVNLMQIIPTLMKIKMAERPTKEELTQLAIETSKRLFPVIEITGLQIDAILQEDISHNCISDEGTPEYPQELPNDDESLFIKAAKQKILNALAQGAAVSMNSIHHMVPELDNVAPTHKEDYDKFLKANEVAYLTAPEEQMIQGAIRANREGEIGGTNKVEFRNGIPYVIARADNFVVLIHEIIKGVYTYLALNAYETEYEYYEIAQYTESIAAEIEDIGCGKMIINLLRDYLIDNFDKYYVHECFFEMFIVAMAKMEAEEMVGLMNGLIKGTPNKARFEILARNCYYDLKDFDKKRNGY